MKFVYIAAAILALIGMIVCSKKQKTNPVMQPVAFVLFVIVVVAGGLFVNEMGLFGGTPGVQANELRFSSSRGSKLGDFLKTAAPGKKVLLVVDPDLAKNDDVKMLGDALRESYNGEVVVEAIEISDNPEGAPLSVIMKAKDFDALVEKHADAGVIVSTVGLPRDANKLKFLQQSADKRPMLFLIGPPSDTSSGFLLPALQKGIIGGVIISNPEAKYDVSAPSDPLEAFGLRYVLVTKENAEQYKEELSHY